MRFARDLIEYEMLDTSGGEKLERWGDRILIRPDPQIIWDTPREHPLWNKADARYFRSSKGGGKWEVYKKMPESWILSYRSLRFRIQPTGFKHTGLFPEQAVNWAYFMDIIQKQKKPVRVLNLFAYTGGATLACASAGAEVCHVDASKGMVSWARENAALSGLSQRPIRWIVEDCEKFVAREIKRGRRYDVIIMDPPSYGRPRRRGLEIRRTDLSLGGFVCRRAVGDSAAFCTKFLYDRIISFCYAILIGCDSGEPFWRKGFSGRNRIACNAKRTDPPVRFYCNMDKRYNNNIRNMVV